MLPTAHVRVLDMVHVLVRDLGELILYPSGYRVSWDDGVFHSLTRRIVVDSAVLTHGKIGYVRLIRLTSVSNGLYRITPQAVRFLPSRD